MPVPVNLKIKANLSCSGCVASVTPYLNNLLGPGNWSVQLTQPGAVITVANPAVTAQGVINALQQAGYIGQVIST